MEWVDENAKFGQRKKTTRNQVALRSNPQMESIMSFVAERVSFEEMKVLQGVSVMTSVWARGWQYKDILNDIDGLLWEDLSEDCQKYLSEVGESPALCSPPQAFKRYP